MKKVEITKIETRDGKVLATWNSFDTDNAEDVANGVWEMENLITQEALQALVAAQAKTLVEPGVSVGFNLAA